MNSQKIAYAGAIVDMERHCVTCGAQLYVPQKSINAVLTSLAHNGIAVLICTCGQIQIIREKRHSPRQRHD